MKLEGAQRVHISAKTLSLQNASCAPSAIAEVLVLTNARLSHDAQLSFISIRQVTAASFAIEDWNVCAQTHCQTHKSEKVYQTV